MLREIITGLYIAVFYDHAKTVFEPLPPLEPKAAYLIEKPDVRYRNSIEGKLE